MFSAKDKLSTEILNVFPEHLCITNLEGKILFVNKAWIDFEYDNTDNKLTNWLNVNYLDVCDKSAAHGFKLAEETAIGIRAVASKKQADFKIEYPCHSPQVQKWFLLKCIPFTYKGNRYLLIQHSNITQKIEANINSNIDALTLVGNRRAFNTFLDHEWRRCERLEHPISAVIIDIDNFKQFNDTFGHLKGDDCLRRVSQILKELVHRPSDIFCRYGGEEFVYILGNTDIHRALGLCEKIHFAVRNLNIAHKKPRQFLTVSIGLASVYPRVCGNKEHLIELADTYLYRAKSSGKNTTCFHHDQQCI
ncbi:MAG: diguanylate cyclase (GGDEF)-like protein [Flavobacteriales bacterium]|jgi:diguanylate cyclase (GGDEF)-like protein